MNTFKKHLSVEKLGAETGIGPVSPLYRTDPMRNPFRLPAARKRRGSSYALIPLTIGVVALASCRRDPGPPPPVGPPTASVSGAERIERIEWDQPPLQGTDPMSYRFVAYIDEVKTELRDAACRARVRPAIYRCTATLPRLSAGRHMIRLSAISTSTGKPLESPRSTVLVVEKH
jgi:hypothetical protein